jgi:hypothetical protein
MKQKKLLLVLFILGSFISCNKNENYVYSPDKKQCITIITENKIRYIIDGKHCKVPNNNYIKLDISNRFSFADNIIGCWKNKEYQWQIINDEATILENKLDAKKFFFSEKLPQDEMGIPSDTIFRKEKNFFYLGFDYGKLKDAYGATFK